MSTARRGGWALVEVLVLTGVVAVSLGLILTTVPKVRETADRMRCSNNLKQLGLSAHDMHYTYGFVPSNPDTVSDHFGTVQYLLLPYME
jgi:type II secretory pathway pseudopilin PulG